MQSNGIDWNALNWIVLSGESQSDWESESDLNDANQRSKFAVKIVIISKSPQSQWSFSINRWI